MNSSESFLSLPFGFEEWPGVIQSVTLALMTFVSEDLTTVGSAIISATGSLAFPTAFLGCWLGIWLGDIGLYGLARGLGRPLLDRRFAQRWVTSTSLRRSEDWIAERGTSLLFICRVIPGTRLPTYLAAGFLRMPLAKFAAATGIAAILWTLLIFGLARVFGDSLGAWLEQKQTQHLWLLLAIVGCAVLIRLLMVVSNARSRQRIFSTARRWTRWEFWPAWLFYPPVIFHGLWLMIKHRGITLPILSNPGIKNGGLVGESKFETLEQLERFQLNFTARSLLIDSENAVQCSDALESGMAHQGIAFPCIFKPDQGQRGGGVRLVRDRNEAKSYLASISGNVVVQEYVDTPGELGIFYYRFPHQSRGSIFGITKKVFPKLVGNGTSTVEELILTDQRARLIASTYLQRLGERGQAILAEGEELPLVLAGNHAQGCIFLDGADLISDELTSRIDDISRSLPGFYIGRYDLRYSSEADLRQGQNFKIIELNGAAAETTNIYDPKNSLITAYRILFKQWDLVFAIGAANRTRENSKIRIVQVWRDWRNFLRMSESYPQAD